ncbi:MAG: MYXO-CTERM sorting domain-containing protein, partial [Myxococcota bacterium]
PNPVRGRWGGPPDNPNGTRATPAQNTAFAARGKLELSSMVADPQAIASVSTLEKVPNSEPRTPPAIPPGLRGPDGGCASCTVQHGTTSEGALWLGSLLGLLAWVMVRRRRQQ